MSVVLYTCTYYSVDMTFSQNNDDAIIMLAVLRVSIALVANEESTNSEDDGWRWIVGGRVCGVCNGGIN